MPIKIEECHPSTPHAAIPSHRLKKALNRLSEVSPNESPLISCFVNLEENLAATLQTFERQARDMERRLTGTRRADFKDAFAEIKNYLKSSLSKKSKGVALYSRWGERPFFLPLEFSVPLASKLILDTLPHIYPIIETKDTYHRFAIVIVTEKEARIVETVMGAITKEIFATRPELRERLGREWTREHYQNHKKNRNDRFLQQKIAIVEELMRQRGHNHLVVAGSPKIVARFTSALPPRLKSKLLTTLHTNPNNGIYPIVVEALEAFAANEHIESHDHVEELWSALMSGGLGVAGIEATRKALSGGYADMLVIAHDMDEPEIKEQLVRLATRNGVPIETVKDSETLERLSGVGCLLRYRPYPHAEAGMEVA